MNTEEFRKMIEKLTTLEKSTLKEGAMMDEQYIDGAINSISIAIEALQEAADRLDKANVTHKLRLYDAILQEFLNSLESGSAYY